jgi:glycosyltransferase involved in cell wall biosynthesis
MTSNPRIGIDATNLLGGGGRTHLIELLSAADPVRHGFSEIVVWGSIETINHLPERDWLRKRPQTVRTTRTLLRRSLWQLTKISGQATKEGCNVLFVPGGSFFGGFRPFVVMSQNMLPFERRERARYGFSLKAARLSLLAITQWLTFLRADSVICLSHYAQSVIQNKLGLGRSKMAVIFHGVNERFYDPPRLQRDISSFSKADPVHIIYVSPIEPYKHHENVIAAMASLRDAFGWPLHLTLVGPASAHRLRELTAVMGQYDKAREWIFCKGFVPFDDIDRLVKAADIGIFASSCEACPNIAIEYMAAGIPIASSHDGPMPEVLGDAAVYFDPEDGKTIETALIDLIQSPDLRSEKAVKAFNRAHDFTWAECADLTFSVLTNDDDGGRAGSKANSR